jgi:hypothetical protein
MLQKARRPRHPEDDLDTVAEIAQVAAIEKTGGELHMAECHSCS